MAIDFPSAISRYGHEAKKKLSNPSVSGEPEAQLRAPLDSLFKDMAELCGFPRAVINAVDESAITSLKTRPDFAITMRELLVGFVEIKAPIRANIRDTTKSNGRNFESYRISFTPMAIHSVSGGMENSMRRSST
jgi:hypothetical protein